MGYLRSILTEKNNTLSRYYAIDNTLRGGSGNGGNTNYGLLDPLPV